VAYCAVSDVQNIMPLWPITTTSKVNVTHVNAHIANCAAEIDSAIASRGLLVPVASPAWFVADLLRLNAQGACALVLMAMFPAESFSARSEGSGSMALGPMLWRTYQNRLADIRKGVGIPVGTAVAEADQAPRSYLTDENAFDSSTATDAFGNHIQSEPFFSIEQVF
jgi:hypothetical protein